MPDNDASTAHRGALEAIPDPVEPGRAGDWAVLSVGLDDSTTFSFDKIQGRYQDRQLVQ